MPLSAKEELSQIAIAKGSRLGSTSQFKGVSWSKQSGKWAVSIRKNGEPYHIGFFKDEIVAGKAYDMFAAKMFGPYAHLNFPDGNHIREIVYNPNWLPPKKQLTSKYRGVYYSKNEDRWRAS